MSERVEPTPDVDLQYSNVICLIDLLPKSNRQLRPPTSASSFQGWTCGRWYPLPP